MHWKILLLATAVALAGCSSFPRGAGLRSEVLAETKNADKTASPEFSVQPVTRDRLGIYAEWPAVGETPMRWINRVDQPDNRILAAGDTITVTLWDTEDNGLLTGPDQRFVTLPAIRVSPGGSVFMPYIGEIPVAGMSPEHARQVIEDRYIATAPSAQVQLVMAEGRQNTVSLVGGVAAPGTYPLPDRDFTVMSLIAEGRGVSGSLRNPQIRLHRNGAIFGISVQKLLENPKLDTTLVGGDKVYVREDDRYFLSLGAAGREAVQPFTQESVTALDAMSIIGGLADGRANAKGILVLRNYPPEALRQDDSGPDNIRTVFTIDLTSADGLFSAGQFLIRPRDLVYVTESPLSSAQTIFGLIGSTFGLARQAVALGD